MMNELIGSQFALNMCVCICLYLQWRETSRISRRVSEVEARLDRFEAIERHLLYREEEKE